MSGMDRLTEAPSRIWWDQDTGASYITREDGDVEYVRADLAHRRESQAAPALQCCMCGKTGLFTVEGDGGEECELHDGRWTCSRVCWDRTAAPAPSDHLVSVGKASGLVEARVSLAARQIRQTLRDYGHRCAETSLPELIAADVDAVLRKQDEVHAPAPSDGLREALERVQRWYPDCTQNQAFMYEADYDGQSKAEWVKLSDVLAALSPEPAQEGGE